MRYTGRCQNDLDVQGQRPWPGRGRPSRASPRRRPAPTRRRGRRRRAGRGRPPPGRGKYLIIQPLIQPSIQPTNIIRGDKIIRQSLGDTGHLSQGVQAGRKALRIRHIDSIEVRKKRPGGFKKRPHLETLSHLDAVPAVPGGARQHVVKIPAGDEWAQPRLEGCEFSLERERS